MLALMPRGSILVKTVRGGLVDEAALNDALNSGHLHAAGLDTISTEPPSKLSFRDSTNTVMTPHIGRVTNDGYRNMGIAAARNMLSVLTKTMEEIK